MHSVASTKKELNIVLTRFGEVYKCLHKSQDPKERFEAAWAMACIGDLYARLNEPYEAESAYKKSIALFEKEGHLLNCAMVCLETAAFFRKVLLAVEAEDMLKRRIVYRIRRLGAGHPDVLAAGEELIHFQRTDEIINAATHRWCKACNIDDYGIGFDLENSDRAEK